VVVDDVEDHLDAGAVERLHQVLELVHDLVRPVARGVLRVRREEADGVVAPVVAQTALEQVGVVDEGVDRHQLDRCDSE